MRQLLLFVMAGASALLVACSQPVRTLPAPSRSAYPATPGEPVQVAPVPAAPAPANEPPRRPQPARQLADGAQLPAVKGLVAAADGALARGDVELAAVNLERAQRLAPQSALVYQRLASVRLRQKRPAEAEQLARKALGYAVSQAQQAALWQLIATARQSQGQHAQAQEARARAAALQSGAAAAAP